MKKVFFCTLFFLLSCSAPSKRDADSSKSKTRADLARSTEKIQAPVLPDEKTIREELSRFQSILQKRKPLTVEDWRLHDKLLDYYIWLKKGAGEANTIFIPAKSRWTKSFESFCLDTDKAVPDNSEVFDWIKSKSSIPYLNELLNLAGKRRDLTQEDVQTIIWNLQNKTNWEEYPKKYQDVLLSIDPQAKQKLPNETKEFLKDTASDVLREYAPAPVDEAFSFIRGKFYDYQDIRSKIEKLKSKAKLSTYADTVPLVPEASLYAETKSHDFFSQEVTVYNPSGEDVIIKISDYQLKPKRQDVQKLALLERKHPYSPELLRDLEKTLFETMMRLGLGHTPILGDLIDLFEASTGRDFFNNDLLTNHERFMSAMSALAGSGQNYRYAKKILNGPVSYVKDVENKYRLIKNTKAYKKLKELVELAHGREIPDDWAVKVSKLMKKDKLQGIVYIHPEHNNIRLRVMPGDPKSKFENSRKPYVRQEIHGRSVDKNGNFVDRQSEGAHIPLEEYKFFEFWKNNGK